MNNIERIQLNYIVRVAEKSIRPAGDVIREEVDKIKSCNSTDQSMNYNQSKTFEDIIPQDVLKMNKGYEYEPNNRN